MLFRSELLGTAENIVKGERSWLLNSIGLIPKIEGEVTKEVSSDLLSLIYELVGVI